MPSFVHTECMCLRKTKPHASPVEEKTALRVLLLLLLLLLLLQRSCSNCPDAHAHVDLEIWWAYVSWTLSLIARKSFFSTVKTQRP